MQHFSAICWRILSVGRGTDGIERGVVIHRGGKLIQGNYSSLVLETIVADEAVRALQSITTS